MSIQTIALRRDETFIQKLVLNKTFWFIFILFGFSYPIFKSLRREIPNNLPVIFSLSEYKLTNEFGKPFGSEDLKGKVYIASFIFTSCATSCPQMMKKMQFIQKRLRGLGTKVGIVTFSVDPETDTPPVLNKYARRFKANPYVWSFLTGPRKNVKDVIINNFKVAMGEKTPGMIDIAHSEKLFLVDGAGKIRGLYSTDKQHVDQMMIDVGILVNTANKIM
ncbi:MAG: SCO family protein [Epsilonproteobacteria bacterium]|nr:MAG: SCO family protein [Campylobacterota bacterium]RLA67465.1 MAG: SCO family protein [Campylobacterota bacterium]